ncbi:MAG: MarR family transcriptional regulator [Pseudomonadota bacterium]
MTTPQHQTDLVFRFFNEIGIINQLATARFAKSLGGALNTTEFAVLNHFVRVTDGVSPSRLARIFQVTKPSMTATLSKLAGKGYVDVAPSPTDKRGKIVTITQEGRRARSRGVAAIAPLAEEMKEIFDLESAATMLPQLVALRERLDEARNIEDDLNR